MISDTLVSGHVLLADWLLIIAAVLFVVAAAAVVASGSPEPPTGSPRGLAARVAPLVGLALVALALAVL